MNATHFTPDQLEMMAKAYYSDKISMALGSQFMGVVWDAVFIGIISQQALKWIPCARHDSLQIRILTSIAIIGALGATIFTWINFFDAFVLLFGTYLRFASWNHLGVLLIFNGMSIIPIEMVFTNRAVRINGNSKVLAVILYSLILATFICTIGSFISTRGHTMFDGTQLMVHFFLAQGTICASMHLSVTGAIIYGLLKNREGSKRTNRMIDNIIMLTLEGQIPGTIVSILNIMLAAINLGNPFIPWIMIAHPKIYMIGCLAMLNTRHSWSREGRLHENSNMNSSNSNSRGTLSSTDSKATLCAPPPSVNNRISVRTSTVQLYDDLTPVPQEKAATVSWTGSARAQSMLAFLKKDKKVDEERKRRASASFGPIFDTQLGSKEVSMA